MLTPQEVCDLFVILKRMVSEGHALIFISHKLHEVMEISTRITVLRDGKMIGTRPAAGVTRDELVKMMVGREVKPLAPQPMQAGAPRLQIQGLHAMGDRGTEALQGVDLEVRSGEIVGLAGVSGNGQRELAQCMSGLRTATAGTILMEGKDIAHLSLRERVEAGLAYVPEERMRDGAIRDFSVQENVFLHDHTSPQFTNGIFLNFKKMAEHAGTLTKQFAVKTASLDTPIKNLSGGNIQKVILARELPRKPHVLIAAQPTARGGHRRDRIHPPAPDGAARRGHRHPADLRGPGRDPRPLRPDRGDLRRQDHGHRRPRRGDGGGDRPDDGRDPCQ